MKEYIDKDIVKAELERRKIPFKKDIDDGVYPTYLCALMDFEDFLDTLEVKEVDLEKKKEVKVKGFVAVDNCGDKTICNPTGRRVAFFPQKPVRDLLTNNHYWAAHISPYDVIHLGYEDFPELKWEDEPIEAEITINKVL